ncbi:MAG: hypothetical protein NTW10_11750, partial [Bacteroidetes bacterium]|nr:hypothetical protein [Bacteroidota bacterium]
TTVVIASEAKQSPSIPNNLCHCERSEAISFSPQQPLSLRAKRSNLLLSPTTVVIASEAKQSHSIPNNLCHCEDPEHSGLYPVRSRFRAKHAFGVTALAKAAYAATGIVYSVPPFELKKNRLMKFA